RSPPMRAPRLSGRRPLHRLSSMRRREITALGAGVMVTLLAGGASASARVQPLVVVYRDRVADPDTVTSRLQAADAITTRFRYRAALKGFAASLSDAQRSRVAADPDVAYVGP